MRGIVALVMITAASVATARDTEPEQQVRALMVEAIDAASGRSSGILRGPLADAMQARFQTVAPITVEVTTLRRLSQRGCSRLNVRFQQAGVITASLPAGRTQSMDVGINYCRDGSAPAQSR